MRDFIRYLALWLWIRGFGRLPLRVLYAIADAGGTLVWYGNPRLRGVALDHMRHVYAGAAPPAQIERAARGNVRAAGRYWADMARAAHAQPEEVMDRIAAIDGLDRFFEAYDRGCGVLFVSAHLGNPETLIRAIGTLGFDILVLTEPLSPPRVHDLVHEVRQAPGVRFVPADRGGVRLALEQLRAGKVLGMLADRDVLGTARPRPFFGERARIPTGAVDLALRTKTPIVTGVARRAGDGGRMHVVLDPPIDLEHSGDREADVEAGMERVVRALEAGIRASPEQWFAMHPVWGGLTS